MEGQLTIFIALTAVAILLQAGVLVAIYLAVARVEKDTRRVRKQIDQRIDPVLDNLQAVSNNARDFSDDARRQMLKFDKIADEISDRLRLQVLRLDNLLGDALSQMEEAGSSVRDTVTGPVREAHALVQGVKAALANLSLQRHRRRRPESEEELFI